MRNEAGRTLSSSTALGDAFIRAFHLQDCAEPVFADPVARSLLTDAEWARFTSSAQRSVRRIRPDLAEDPVRAVRYWITEMSVAAPHVLVRARYAEDVLRQEAADHPVQYILLGAGLDSFTLRRPEWALDVDVFEIDHPATQALKQERAGGLSGDAGRHLRRLAADLAERRLADVLAAAPRLDPAAPTVVAWCGVTYYLEDAAIEAVLRDLSAFFTGRLSVVLDYWHADYLAEDNQDSEVRSMFASVRRNGEPFISGFTPAGLAARAAAQGFAVADDAAAIDVAARLRDEGGASVRPHAIGRLAHLRKVPA